MSRLVALLVLAAVVLGVAGLAVTTERTSAQQLPAVGDRFDLQCTQIVAPNDENNPYPGIGVVRCSLRIDLPAFLEPPDTIKLTIYAAYRDVDGNKRPSPGDRLLCVRVIGPGGNVLLEKCRPGIDIPPDFSLPGS